jgi:DHA3 family tetracycline resistance protein-like MFS transporter
LNSFGYAIRYPNAQLVYLGMRAAAAFAFSLVITYELVYHTVVVGLNPLQLVTVGVVLECMTFFFEIPTGVIADLYSRRLSVIIGYFLFGVGFLVEGMFATFAAVLIAQVLWGIGFTFYSGAGDAWIADEVGEARVSQIYLRATQVSQIMSLAGVGAGALIVGYGLHWPIISGAAIYLALVPLLLWFMTEAGYQPAAHQTELGLFKSIVTPLQASVQLVRIRPILATILLVGVVIGLCIGGFDRLEAAHFTGNFTLPQLGALEPVAWFSIMSGVIGVLSLISTELVRRRLDVTSNARVARLLSVLYSGMIVCMLLFALTGSFYLALLAFCVSQTLRNTGRPLLIIWINQNTKPQVRATVISMYWQANAFGQIVGSPLIGWIGMRFSLRAALAVGAVIYTAVLPLLRFAGTNPQAPAKEHELVTPNIK